jgi:hypothetical protein
MVQMFDLPRSLSGVLGEQLAQGASKVGQNIGQQKQQSAMSRLLSGQGGEEDLAQLSPEQQIQLMQSLQPKAPAGGLSGQAVPPDVQMSIAEIVSKNPNSTAEELSIQLDQAGVPRAYSNSYIENRRRSDDRKQDLAQKKFESERTYQSKRAIPFLQKLDESRNSLQEKDQALFLMRDAINQGNLEFFYKDNFANFLGKFGEGLRTAKGAQLINAQKEFLLGNIARAGARPNMYIEQQISKMLPQIGRSDEANLTVIESFQAQQDLEKKKQEISDQLVEKYEQELGYVPGNISAQVDKITKPYADEYQRRLAYRLRNLQESEMGEKAMRKKTNSKVPKGTPLTLQMSMMFIEKEGSKEAGIKKAQKLGYTIPSMDEYRSYLQ